MTNTAQTMKIFIKDFVGKCDQILQETADLVTFTEKKNSNEKFYYLCSRIIRLTE